MKKFLLAAILFLFAFSSFAMAQVDSLSDTDTVSQESSCVDLANNMRYRMNDTQVNNEVSLLQDYLISEGFLTSEATGYFGGATFKAVGKLQTSFGFKPTGYVGPLTRAKIKEQTCSNDALVTDRDSAPAVPSVIPTPVASLAFNGPRTSDNKVDPLNAFILTWDSTNADSYATTISYSGCAISANNGTFSSVPLWRLEGAHGSGVSGSFTSTATHELLGCTVKVLYKATNTSTGKTASAEVVIPFKPWPPTTLVPLQPTVQTPSLSSVPSAQVSIGVPYGRGSVDNADPHGSFAWGWSSTNANMFSTSYAVSGCENPANNGTSNTALWEFSTPIAASASGRGIEGTWRTNYEGFYGCTVKVDYKATNTTNGQTATDSATIVFRSHLSTELPYAEITVHGPASSTDTVNVNPLQPVALWWKAERADTYTTHTTRSGCEDPVQNGASTTSLWKEVGASGSGNSGSINSKVYGTGFYGCTVKVVYKAINTLAGQSATANATITFKTASLPAGCTSTTLYSPTTARKCTTDKSATTATTNANKAPTAATTLVVTVTPPVLLTPAPVKTQAAPTPAAPPSPTVTLRATPDVGGYTTLTWTSTGATGCTTEGGWTAGEIVGQAGSNSVRPTNETTYVLSCTGAGGKTYASVTVKAPLNTPSASLSASPTNVVPGGLTNLAWSSTNATSCILTTPTSSEPVGPQGSKFVNIPPTASPKSTVIYSIACSAGGNASTDFLNPAYAEVVVQ